MRSCKRFLSVLACAALVLAFGLRANAEEAEAGWSLEEGVLCISGQGEMAFPTPLPWEDAKGEITALKVDEGVTAIQAEALRGCTALASVTLPKTLRYIHDSAFADCTSLYWVTLPEGIIGIGEDAFAGCSKLSTVFLPGSVAWVGDGAFDQNVLINCTAGTGAQDYITATGGRFHQIDQRKLQDGEGTWTGGSWTLSGGVMTLTGAGTVALAEGELYYPWDALRGDITDVVLEEGITAVDARAFTLCRKLVTVTFPNSIETIDPDALDTAQEIIGAAGSTAETFAGEKGIAFTARIEEAAEDTEPVDPETAPAAEDAAETPEETTETAVQEENTPQETVAPDEEPQQETAPQAEDTPEGTEETTPQETNTPEESTAPEEDTTSEAPEASKPVLTVASASAQPGQSVRLTVTLAGNPGLCGLNFQIEYDHTRLTLEDFDCDDGIFALGDWTVGVGEGEKALWLQPDETEANGNILTLQFRIAQDAPAGELPVTLTAVSGVNGQAELVEPDSLPGTVAVTVGIPGDINGDGRITSADLLRLRRYLAGQNVPVETGNADLNGDGKIDLQDVILLQNILTGE